VYGPFYRKWIDIVNKKKLLDNNLIQISKTCKKFI